MEKVLDKAIGMGQDVGAKDVKGQRTKDIAAGYRGMNWASQGQGSWEGTNIWRGEDMAAGMGQGFGIKKKGQRFGVTRTKP